jgi:prophage regulatory protein
MTYRSDDEKHLPMLMRIKDVCDLLKISRATVYRWVEEGKFPEPVVLGQEDGKRSAIRWYTHDVTDWLVGRPKGIQKNDT